MAINKFRTGLKKASNSTIIDNELKLLDNVQSSLLITDTVYTKLSKIPTVTRRNLKFLNDVNWYASRIVGFSDTRVMFTSSEIKNILRSSHKLLNAVKTRLNNIKSAIAEEYPLGVVSVHTSVASKISEHVASNLSFELVVFDSDIQAVLWFKSDAHGGEFLKANFNSSNNRIDFDFK